MSSRLPLGGGQRGPDLTYGTDATMFVVEFDFGERVVVRRTVRTVADGTVGLAGYMAGVSRVNDGADVLSYAVSLDDRECVFMIESGDLEPAYVQHQLALCRGEGGMLSCRRSHTPLA